MKTETLGGLSARITGGTDGDGGGDGPLVVLAHGFGAPGDDLVPLARVTKAPKGTRWVFPWAPIKLDPRLAGDGRAWWEIDMMALQLAMMRGRPRDFLGEEPAGLAAARAKMVALLEALPARFGVGLERVVLGGFSQGAMLSMDVALRTKLPLAGVALLSGTFLCEGVWRPAMSDRAGMRVFQSHGRQDPILPFALAEQLRDALTGAGASVKWVQFNGGHEIPGPVLDGLGDFVTGALSG